MKFFFEKKERGRENISISLKKENRSMLIYQENYIQDVTNDFNFRDMFIRC